MSVCVRVLDLDTVAEYFQFVATEIASNQDEGSVVGAFRAALDDVSEQLTRITLSHSRLLAFADLMVFFTRNVHLAQVGHVTLGSDSSNSKSNRIIYIALGDQGHVTTQSSTCFLLSIARLASML